MQAKACKPTTNLNTLFRGVFFGCELCCAAFDEAAMSVWLCWIVLPGAIRNPRRSAEGKAERWWSINPAELPDIARHDLNEKLAAASIEPWQACWDAANVLNKLFLECEAKLDAEAGGRLLRTMTASGFWARPEVVAAFGNLVGLALLGPAEMGTDPLSWSSVEHRFYQRASATSWKDRLAYFRVIDVVAIGNFAQDGLKPASVSEDLMPIGHDSQVNRVPLFKVEDKVADAWMGLPCKQFDACGGEGGRIFDVADVLESWRASYPEVGDSTPSTAMTVWTPIAAALLRKQWMWLAYGAPKLNRQLRARKGTLFEDVFGHLDFDENPVDVADRSEVLSKNDTIVRLRSLADSIRVWSPKILAPGPEPVSDDLRFSRAWLP